MGREKIVMSLSDCLSCRSTWDPMTLNVGKY
jgi:hypothetical protein